MNILQIAKKEILQAFRNKSTFIFMLAFPIALMLILGLALSNAFSSNIDVGPIKMAYTQGQVTPQLAAGWQSFVEAAQGEGVTIEPLPPGQDGREAVKQADYAAYVEVSDQGIDLYASSRGTVESNIVQAMLNAFADRYNLAAALAGESTGATSDTSALSLVKETALTHDSEPNSMDYYAIAMTTMIALYATLSGAALIEGERTRHTIVRLSAAPVTKAELFVGKVLGSTVVNTIFIVAVMLLSRYAFGADWGEHIGYILLVLLTEVLLAVGIGLTVGMLINSKASRAFLMIFLQIASFLGGAYFPVSDVGGFIGAVSRFSPLHWNNSGIIDTVFRGDTAAALTAAGCNLLVAAALLAICSIQIRRRETI